MWKISQQIVVQCQQNRSVYSWCFKCGRKHLIVLFFLQKNEFSPLLHRLLGSHGEQSEVDSVFYSVNYVQYDDVVWKTSATCRGTCILETSERIEPSGRFVIFTERSASSSHITGTKRAARAVFCLWALLFGWVYSTFDIKQRHDHQRSPEGHVHDNRYYSAPFIFHRDSMTSIIVFLFALFVSMWWYL